MPGIADRSRRGPGRTDSGDPPDNFQEAVQLAIDCSYAKFDESVDVAVKLGVNPRHADQMVTEILRFIERNVAFGSVADIHTEIIPFD